MGQVSKIHINSPWIEKHIATKIVVYIYIYQCSILCWGLYIIEFSTPADTCKGLWEPASYCKEGSQFQGGLSNLSGNISMGFEGKEYNRPVLQSGWKISRLIFECEAVGASDL